MRRAAAAVMALAVVALAACGAGGGPAPGAAGPGTTSGSSGSAAPSPGSSTGTSPGTPGRGIAGDVPSWSQVEGTDGRDFVADAAGRARQLRGFNIKTRDPLRDASDELLAAGQQRGFDLLRLSVYWDQFEPTQGAYDDGYLGAVRTVLDRAEAHGLLVIIDFHQDVFGPKFGDHGVPLWATRDGGIPYTQHEVWLQNYLEPAVQEAWDHLYEDPDLRQAQIDAWVTVANRFKDHPALFGYDLLNEPFGKLGAGEDLVTAASRVQKVQLTAMYQRLTDALNKADPAHWVLFEPPNVASLGIPVALGPVNGTKLVYYPHFYDASIESATYAPGGEVNGFDTAFFDKYEAAIRPYVAQNNYPTMFGEWGIAHPEKPGMADFVARSLALMDRVGSGWTMFNWCKGTGYCPLDKEGKDREAIGQIVAPWARAIAGSPTSYLWDPKARTLKVVYKDNDAKGPTELVVPATTYPEGWSVEGAGATTATNGLVVEVTVPKTGGEHVLCLHAKGGPACA